MPTDEDLMLLAGQGDLKGFELIVRRNQKIAWSVAYRFLNDAQEAEDIVQEAFLKILNGASNYRPSASFKTYLYRVVANLCLDFKRKFVPTYSNFPPDLADDDPGPADQVLSHEQQSLVRQALSTLPTQHRMAIILRYYEGLGYREIAQVLQISEKAVERLLARGRDSLQIVLIK